MHTTLTSTNSKQPLISGLFYSLEFAPQLGLDVEADTDKEEEKIEALADIICRAGDEPEIKAAALLVLLATVENAPDARALANKAKHLVFTRCGELNCYDMVDNQIARIENELLASIIED